mgnify:CR=1 FL=1
MDSLQIDTGEIRLAINGDASRVIVLRPNDAVFAEKFYKMLGEFQSKFTEYQGRAAKIESQNETDENGVPLNTGERIALLKEICQYTRNQIDELLGAGTSQTVFGDALDIEAIIRFFEGVRPYMQKARAEKVARYTNKTYQKRK